MAHDPGHQSVQVTGKRPCSVFNSLASSYLDIPGVQVKSMSPEIGHSDLERYPGSCRGFLKDHPETFVLEVLGRLSCLSLFLQVRGRSEEFIDLLPGQISYRQYI